MSGNFKEVLFRTIKNLNEYYISQENEENDNRNKKDDSLIIVDNINSLEEKLKEEGTDLNKIFKEYSLTIYNYFKNMKIVEGINYLLSDDFCTDFVSITEKYLDDPLFKKYIDSVSRKDTSYFKLKSNIEDNINNLKKIYKIDNKYDYLLLRSSYVLHFLNYIIDAKKNDLSAIDNNFINNNFKIDISLNKHLENIYSYSLSNVYDNFEDYKIYRLTNYNAINFPEKGELFRTIYFDYLLFVLNVTEDNYLNFNKQFEIKNMFDYMSSELKDYFYDTYNTLNQNQEKLNIKSIFKLKPRDILKHKVNENDDRKCMIDEIKKYYTSSLKKCIYGNNEMLSKLDILAKKYPNFEKVIDYVKGSVKKSILSNKPLSFSPINLQGDPGIGKTYFANNLANAIDMDSNFIAIGSISNGFEISGMTNRYASSNVGYFTDIVFNKTDNLQNVIILDELCKTKFEATQNGTSALPSVLSALDKKTAKNFEDTFLEIKYDISNVFFISTTNDYSILPDPLKSRLINFNIEYPNKEEYNNIFFTILNEVIDDVKDKVSINIDYNEIYKDMSDVSPRDLNRIFDETLSMSILDDNNIVDGKYVINNDMIRKSIISMKQNNNKVGFV